ncbi:MAG TPA: pyridoxal-dependent decarboxylase [Caulobacteraceae bacterium]
MTPDPALETDLDPQDWPAFRAQAHAMLDDILDHVAQVRQRPVWRAPPDPLPSSLSGPAPLSGAALAEIHADFMRDVAPFTVGNLHPRFMGWVHGSGTVVGLVAEMLAAGLNANLGGRWQAPIQLERQVVSWMAELIGFPETSSGIFVTGASMANFVAVLVARTAALGPGSRTQGIAAVGGRLRAYASIDAHNCIARAMEMAGLGSDALRLIGTDHEARMDHASVCEAVEQDRAAGLQPFLIVGTAGTVDTGAVDDLFALAELAEREGLHFHVDGAIGGLGVMSPELKPQFTGIERADSIALDFHKWGQAPYDAGFVLVRDPNRHMAAFASPAAYLGRAGRGLAAGSPWPCDFGPDLSRGFRALKVWFTLRAYGADRLGAAMLQTCRLARRLADRIDREPELERLAPAGLNIVCFRYRAGAASDALNAELVAELQESGVAAPSTTRIGGQLAIRAAIVGHRTRSEDVDALADAVLAIGRRLSRSVAAEV